MLKEKNALLIHELTKLIRKYSDNSKVYDIISKGFLRKNLSSSNAKNILTGKFLLETLNNDNPKDLFLLFVFTNSFQKALSTIDEITKDTYGSPNEYEKIDVKNYFTDVEIEEFKETKFEKKEVSKYPYRFRHMLKVADGHYSGIISAKDLAMIDASNDIIYNFATQRDPKIDVFGMKRINIDREKIGEIDEALRAGDYFSDEIKLNVLKDGEDDIIFHSKDGVYGELIINSGNMTIFDGYHRKTSNSIAISQNSNPEFNWKLAITNYSEPKAKKFMTQINKQKPIKREHIKNIDDSKNENVIVNNILDNSNSELAGQIKDSDAELKYSGLTKKSILATAIEEQYKEFLVNKTRNMEISDWIVKFTNYLMGVYDKEFLFDVAETRKVSYINHKNMFMGYIALSRYLYEKNDWQSQLKDIMSNIDFNINNPIWKTIKIEDGELNKTSKDALYKLFLGKEV